MSTYLKNIFTRFIFVLVLLYFGNGTAQYEIINEAGHADSNQMALANKNVTIADKSFQKYFNYVPRDDVKIFVCASEQDFINVLMREMNTQYSEAKDVAAEVQGMHLEGKIAIYAVADQEGIAEYLHTMTHELFHEIQDEISGKTGFGNNAVYWLCEGSAELAGGLAEVEAGYLKDIKEYRRNMVSDYIETGANISASELFLMPIDTYQALKDSNEYTVSALMTLYLCPKTTDYKKLINYYRQGTTDKADEVIEFSIVFQRQPDEFVERFDGWLEKAINRQIN